MTLDRVLLSRARLWCGLAIAVLQAACASVPSAGEDVLVVVSEVLVPGSKEASRHSQPVRFQALGVDEQGVAAGRVVRVHCATMADGWWDSLAVLPPNVVAAKGATLRLRVTDPGTNDRLGVNQAIALASPQLPEPGQAYRFIPNWRELGRRTNLEQVELPPELRGKYAIVQSWYMLRCRSR